MDEINIEKYSVADITIKSYYINNNKKMPCIIVIHGYTTNKEKIEEYYGFGTKLSQAGFYVITIDAYMHGERSSIEFEELSIKEKEEYYFEILNRTVKDVNKIVEFIKEDKRFDEDKIGILGLSFGGMAAFCAAAWNDDIKYAAALMASPYFEEFAIYRLEQMGANIEEYRGKLGIIKAMLPMDKLDQYPLRPLYMANGRYDTKMPFLHSLEFYNSVKNRYLEKGDDIVFKLYDVEHCVNEEIANDCVEWLKRFCIKD